MGSPSTLSATHRQFVEFVVSRRLYMCHRPDWDMYVAVWHVLPRCSIAVRSYVHTILCNNPSVTRTIACVGKMACSSSLVPKLKLVISRPHIFYLEARWWWNKSKPWTASRPSSVDEGRPGHGPTHGNVTVISSWSLYILTVDQSNNICNVDSPIFILYHCIQSRVCFSPD